MEDVETGLLRPYNLLLEIAEFILVVTMADMYLGIKIPATISLTIVELIILMLMLEVELGLKRPATLTLSIVEKELMLTGGVDKGFRPSTLFPITQAALVDF